MTQVGQMPWSELVQVFGVIIAAIMFVLLIAGAMLKDDTANQPDTGEDMN